MSKDKLDVVQLMYSTLRKFNDMTLYIVEVNAKGFGRYSNHCKVFTFMLNEKPTPRDIIRKEKVMNSFHKYFTLESRLWVTPFENKKSLVKFGYLVATLNLFFFLSLNSKAISSRSAIV